MYDVQRSQYSIAIENIFLPEDGSAGNFVGQVACQYNDIGAPPSNTLQKNSLSKAFYCAGSVGMVFMKATRLVDQALEDFAGRSSWLRHYTVTGDRKSMQVTQDFIATGKNLM